jgi:hypothetical protein
VTGAPTAAAAALAGHGDCITRGSYSLHSRFTKAANYTCGGALLSLVGEETGNGPVNVVLRGPLPTGRGRCTVGEGTLRVGDLSFDLPPELVYVSTLPAFAANPAAFARNLAFFSRILVRDSPPLSLAFLLDTRRERHFDSSFERALLRRVKEGWGLIRGGDVRCGARLLIGAGYGFTPSGDDFIAGYLSGLFTLQRYFHEDVEGAREAVRAAGAAGNPVSDSVIRHAMSGRFPERGKSLLLALIRGSSSAVEEAAHRVLSAGETSGADFSTGLVCSMKTLGH